MWTKFVLSRESVIVLVGWLNRYDLLVEKIDMFFRFFFLYVGESDILSVSITRRFGKTWQNLPAKMSLHLPFFPAADKLLKLDVPFRFSLTSLIVPSATIFFHFNPMFPSEKFHCTSITTNIWNLFRLWRKYSSLKIFIVIIQLIINHNIIINY